MAPSTSSAAQPAPRFSLSRKLRKVTWINPQTGEQSKRSFTLREASNRLSVADNDAPSVRLNGSGSSSHERHQAVRSSTWDNLDTQLHRAWLFICSRTGQDILKCSLAYLIGSFATFVPVISGLFGHKQDSKHLVATITVYFAPARTLGNMVEALAFALIAFAYASFLSFTSMGLSVAFRDLNMLGLGHAIVLIVFVGGGLGMIAWVKQHFGHPLVNTATSLASLSSITILIKEGSVQAGEFSTARVTTILNMVILGICIAALINVLLFPSFARRKLIKSIEQNTDLLGEMLVSITRAFLMGREEDLQDEYYKELAQEHQDCLGAMSKHLIEAKWEHLPVGNERFYDAETRVVECLTGLSQDLGGLRSAAFAQFAFIKQSVNVEQPSLTESSNLAIPRSLHRRIGSTASAILDVITEDPEEASLPDLTSTSLGAGTPLERTPWTTTPSTPNATMRASSTEVSADSGDLRRAETLPISITKSPNDMFVGFISQLGPPIKSLVFTIKQILNELPFEEESHLRNKWNPWSPRTHSVAINEQFHTSLKQAVDLYRQSRKEALNTLYQSRALSVAISAVQTENKSDYRRRTPGSMSPSNDNTSTSTPTYGANHNEILADIEEVTACCGHFSFSLLDFAEGILEYLHLLEDLKSAMESDTRTWNWLNPFRRTSHSLPKPTVTRPPPFDPNHEDHDPHFNLTTRVEKPHHTASSPHPRPWYHRIYRASRILRRDDVRYGIKVGIGAALYALPAFLPETRPFFVHWRGEWGLVSYMVCSVLTLGASNSTAIERVVGTCVGAVLAVLAWVVANRGGEANPWVLGLFGWIVSVPCFWLMYARNRGPMSRFILLTYNLGALYSYSLSINDDDNDDDEGGIDPAIWDIVVHRVVAVIAGVIWAVIVTRGIWPLSARRKLREGLCTLLLRMGLVWKRDPLAQIMQGESRVSYMNISEEASLHTYLSILKGLRKAASSEFDLRGPFPDGAISRILDRAGRMLDAFHAINVAIGKNLQYTPGEAAVLEYTRVERAALSARISHLLTVLASSIKMQYPLNDVLPNIENTRDRLLAKISEYRQTSGAREVTTEQDYEMLYAYVLVTGQLAEDIQAVGDELAVLYGTLNEENLKLD